MSARVATLIAGLAAGCSAGAVDFDGGGASGGTGDVCPLNAQRIDGVCVCLPGWFGDDCTACPPGLTREGGACVVGCGPDTCAGHGTCTTSDGVVDCACEDGWGEPYCATCAQGLALVDGECVDPCAGRDCSGRGICDGYSGHAVCLCDAGYIGRDCERCAPYYRDAGGTCVLACEPDSCSGNGTCDGYTGTPVCTCENGYIGDDCSACPFAYADVGDACVPVCDLGTCVNASCDPSSGAAVCTCYDTFVAPQCSGCAATYEDLGGGVCGSPVLDIDGRLVRTCALLENGTLRCWGGNLFADLGYPGTDPVGCDTRPIYSVGAVAIAGTVTQLAAGREHTCVLLDTGEVRCWGSNFSGQLGYGHTQSIGDDEPIDAGGPVAIGGTAAFVAAGFSNTCVVLTAGGVRCWGRGASLFATENHENVGDNETPDTVATLDLGGPVEEIVIGSDTACARRSDGAVRCWGSNGFGVLGTGTPGSWRGPTTAIDVDLPDAAVDLAIGDYHACAALADGSLYCWGINYAGQLGYGDTNHVGQAETPGAKGPVDVGGPVVQVEADGDATCARLTGGTLRCWGSSAGGALGHPDYPDDIGDDEPPSIAGDVALGSSVLDVTLGDRHTCALLGSGAVRCWGNSGGFCALGNAQPNGGSGSDPALAPDVALFWAD